MAYEPRWYIEEAIDATFDYFAAHGGTAPDGSPVQANPLICMPTGTGKSYFIAEFTRRAMQQHPGTRIFMSTHVKELIKQNAARLQDCWPLAPLGVYSAGLGQRDTMQPIIFGGIQSCVNKFPLFGRRDLLVVDEAHLMSASSDTSYLKFVQELQCGISGVNRDSPNINPYLKVIGLSATPYRLGLGHLTNGPIFTDVAYNLCTIDGFNRLIAEGYMSPIYGKRTNTELDVSNVGMSKGEFDQNKLQAAVDKETVTFAALKEFVEDGIDRASWLVFASGIEHAEHIAEMLNNVFGIPTVCIHSKKGEVENAKSLELWKTGKVRCAVNINGLTTGVDHPACDCIGMFRPTMSPGLWVQMLGRGTRPYDPAKEMNLAVRAAFPFKKLFCLVKDFAGNTRRLGPINDPVIPKLKGMGPPGDAPVRTCEKCGTYNHSSARECVVCGHVFTFAEKLNRHASGLELLRSDLPQIENYKVDRMVMTAHESRSSGNGSIRIAYFCGIKCFFEYKSVQSTSNMFRKRSRDWFRQVYHYRAIPETWDGDVPKTNAEVLAITHELRKPASINVWVNKQTPEVMGIEF